MPFRLKAETLELLERDVTKQVLDWLRVRRWRCQRQQSAFIKMQEAEPHKGKKARFVRFGEKSQTDYICFRSSWVAGRRKFCELFYLELKRPGQRPSWDQDQWIRLPEMEGFLVCWSNNCRRSSAGTRNTFRMS